MITQMRTSKGYLLRACHSKGVSHHHQGSGKQPEEWEAFKQRRGWLWACSDGGRLACRSCRQAHQKWGILCDRLGEHIWLPPVGPKLEAGAKIKESVTYYSILDHLGLIIQGLSFGLLDWLLQIASPSDRWSHHYPFVYQSLKCKKLKFTSVSQMFI